VKEFQNANDLEVFGAEVNTQIINAAVTKSLVAAAIETSIRLTPAD
jgi:hypothetical protein